MTSRAVRRVASGGPWEDAFGYSRAVAAGPFGFSAGCTSSVEGQVEHAGDPFRQATAAFGIGLAALAELGFAREDVVQTRMFVVHSSDSAEVGRAHLELFGDIRPAATMVAVSALLDPRMLVEVELVAYRGTGA